MNVIGLSEYHESNLRKLAAYLLAFPAVTRFHMMLFAELGRAYDVDCGTVGCAVGHGPYAGVPKTQFENWDQYSYRCFIPIDGSEGGYDRWAWCFAPDWWDVDNTPDGAARRILWMLDRGLPKQDEQYRQMHGKSPLCYLDYQPPVEIPAVFIGQPYQADGSVQRLKVGGKKVAIAE